MKRLGIILFWDIRTDSRAQRTASVLSEVYDVRIYHISKETYSGIELIEKCTVFELPEKQVGKLANYLSPLTVYDDIYFNFIISKETQLDLVYCHDLYSLSLGLKLKIHFNSKLIYDVHDLVVETLNQGFPVASGLLKLKNKIVLNYLKMRYYLGEKKMIKSANLVITVNDSLQQYLRNKYKIDNCFTINNYPILVKQSIRENSNRLKEELNIENNKNIVIYHGNLGGGRFLRQIVESAKYFNQEIVLVIMGNGQLENELKANAGKNVFFHDSVPYDQLYSYTSSANLGIVLLEHINFSKKHASANKFFEYMACGIPVLCSDSPELSKVISKTDAGYIIKESISPEVIAREINSIFADIEIMREKGKNGLSFYSSTFNWENESKVLHETFNNILS